MKIAIMSMQRIINYGSFLQAYALKNIIKSINQNNTVVFADFHVHKPLIEQEKGRGKLIKFLSSKGSVLNKLKYRRFRKGYPKKYFKYLEIDNNKNYNPYVDILVIGSDEVFNCLQLSQDVGYSLELFGQNNNANKVISYAASFGNTTYDKLVENNVALELSVLLKRFDSISVRDINSYNIVNRLLGTKPIINIDPVLLYDFSQDQLFKTKTIDDDYLLIYAYSGRISEEEARAIRQYTKKNQLKIYCIGGTQLCCDKLVCCSPFEIFNYFKCAKKVVTDTFHGTIFSILTNASFVTLIRQSNESSYGNEEKLSSLLNMFNLNSRICKEIGKIEQLLNKEIDYSYYSQQIRCERKKSFQYLKKNLIGN